MQISRGKFDRLHRTPAESTALAHGERWTSRIRARSSDQDCLYSVSVRQVATLLPRFFQTVPRGDRPCASLALCLTGPGQRTFTSKLSNMLGTPGAVGAFSASTAPAASTGGFPIVGCARRSNDRVGGSQNDDRQSPRPRTIPGVTHRNHRSPSYPGTWVTPSCPRTRACRSSIRPSNTLQK
jgi:hypothetical protein